jgi:hypothetical protein
MQQTIVVAQSQELAADAAKSSGVLPVGMGATFIDGQTYYLLNFRPEFTSGNFGIGLDVNLRIGTDGKLRSDYNKFSDYLRLIRYARWAQKGDPFYIRAGELDNALLGHGFIMEGYQNSSSYDLRKTGLELDLNFEKFGFESVMSDLAHAGIIGVRGYVKPLKYTALEKLPVLNNFEIGATYVTDRADNADVSMDGTKKLTSNAMSIYGFDAGLPLLSYRTIKSTLYADYAKIINYGNGAAVGIDFRLSGMGLLTINAKYERQFNGDQFIASYFDGLYELDRYTVDGTSFKSKADTLRNAKQSQGNYGSIVISFLNTFNIVGQYHAPVGEDNAGFFHAVLNVPNVIPSVVLNGGYDRKNIGSFFKLDENSLLYAEVGYKPLSFMIVSMVYQWTWTLDNNGEYVSQKRIEPKVSFVYQF